MRQKIIMSDFIGKKFGGVTITKSIGVIGRYRFVEIECAVCKNKCEKQFHNVISGNLSSCGCQKKSSGSFSKQWKGVGEIGKSFFYSIEVGAKSRNLPFSITMQQIWDLFLKQDRKCAYSGQILRFSTNRNSHDGTASLDRIDSSKGYVKDNIQWIHKDINRMKQHFSENNFLYLVKLISKYRFLT